ncbi:MAG TPA: AAA family ATPase [Phycisphaerales bacterium]|nr:AAA family ATPase [Phycisphaerales bacterium]HMP38282.1 AAA family ATPase [Phycisphaerales bacterium]
MTSIAAKPATAPRPAPARSVASSLGVSIDPIKVLRRHIVLIVVMAFIGAMIGFGAYIYADRTFPKYTGRVGFELLPQVRSAMDPLARGGDGGDSVLRSLRTEAEYLVSRDVLSDALKTNRDVRENTVWGRGFVGPDGNFAFDDAMRDLMKKVSPVVGRETNLFFLEWSAATPADVPVVLNAIADSYIRFRTSIEMRQFDAALAQFQVQVSQLETAINQRQLAVEEFIKTNSLTALDSARESQLMDTAKSITSSISRTIQSRVGAESTKKQIEDKLRGTIEFSQDDRQAAEEDPNIRALTQRVNSARVALNLARDRYRPGHAELRLREQEVAAAEAEREAGIREQIRRNLNSQLTSTILALEVIDSQLEDLKAQSDEKTEQLRDTTALIAQYRTMEKDLRQHEERRAEFEKVIRDTFVIKAREDARRVRRAFAATVPHEKSFPKLLTFVPLGAIALAGLVTGVVFLREILDQRVKGASDLAAIPGARVLGVIPDLDEDPTRCERAEMVVAERPQSVLAESYRQASVPLLKALDARGSRSLLVLGGLPGSGTTTVVTNLAAIDAAAGRRVLVIDANFRRPGLAAALKIRDDAPGLGDLLAGRAGLAEVIQPVSDGFDAITAGTPALRVFERLNTARFDAALAELRSGYDIVLVDAPPAIVAGEAIVLAGKVDAVVLVVRANQEQRGLVARLIRQLNDVRCDFLGVILNRPRVAAGGYLRKNYATMAGYARSS